MTKFSKILYIILLFCSVTALGQNKTKKITTGGFDFEFSTVDPTINDVFCHEGQEPEFPGGMTKLVAFAKRNIDYPKSAINDNLEGHVILLFSINKRGKIIEKKLYKRARADFNIVCLKMLDKMPLWKPGKLSGRSIDVQLKWSIKFRLTD